MNDTAKIVVLIVTRLLRRGSGDSEDSPVRIITEYWTPAGEKIGEEDPASILMTPEKRAEIRKLVESTAAMPSNIWDKLLPLLS